MSVSPEIAPAGSSHDPAGAPCLVPDVGVLVESVGEVGSVGGLVAGRVACSAVDGPGRRYVLLLQGCSFDCLACRDPAALTRRPPGMVPRTVDDVVEEIAEAAPYLNGVTVSGGEPTQQPEFVHALLSRLAQRRGTRRLTRFVESNGDAEPAVWQLLAPVTDAFMIDLKALDDETHVVLTGRSNVQVLESIRTLAAIGLLYEVRLLPIPGLNDSDAELEAIAAWLLSVDSSIRVRVNEFHRLGTRETAHELLQPRRAELVRYRQVLTRAGIADLVVP
jgi:pyruvate formate lyase activating enzyme